MSSERPFESASPPVSGRVSQPPEQREEGADARRSQTHQDDAAKAKSGQATVIVRGETVRGEESSSGSQNPPPKDKPGPADKANKKVSEARVSLFKRLPQLDDDAEVGVEKEHRVVRDNKADLAFVGTLRASAALPSETEGYWQEYRIYETDGGKHVFSKITRSVFERESDRHEAEVFDPAPSSVPSQIVRGAKELARQKPVEWTDAAVAFFGYNPLSKALYRKFGDQFDEHIT
jgi:hypothetical protein